MAFRRIAVDVDGTLLRSDGIVSAYTREVLTRGAPIALTESNANDGVARALERILLTDEARA